MKALYVTYCSGKKNPIVEGTPEQLYDSQRITDFMRACKFKGYNWAILSAKYGLFFPYEVRKNYNVTFKSVAYVCRIVEDNVLLSEQESHRCFASLVQQTKNHILEQGFERVIFYCVPPLKRRKCYLSVLHAGADGCGNTHYRWDELSDHVEKMFKMGKGKIEVVTKLKNL